MTLQSQESEEIKSEVVETIPEIKIHPQNQDGFSHAPYANNTYIPINNAGTVNIPPPAIPANDMIKLENHHPGAINRILTMSEKELEFTHSFVDKQQKDQFRINDRNIAISREQSQFNTAKLIVVTGFIFLLAGGAIYLFMLDKIVGGVTLSILAVILGSIFILGQFPNGIFEAIFGRNRISSRDIKDDE